MEMLKMPTSGITKTFIVLGKEQTEKFANAIEDSYQESLHRKESLDFEITYLHGADEVKRFMEKCSRRRPPVVRIAAGRVRA